MLVGPLFGIIAVVLLILFYDPEAVVDEEED
jgi:hypothetical protein